jgi:hypothetical protein
MTDSAKQGRANARQSAFAWSATETPDANARHAANDTRDEAESPRVSAGAAACAETTTVAAPPRVSAVRKRRTAPPRQTSLGPGDRWLTPDEAFVHLGLPTRKALYAAVARGQVPVHRWNTRLRFARSELDALLRNGR